MTLKQKLELAAENPFGEGPELTTLEDVEILIDDRADTLERDIQGIETRLENQGWALWLICFLLAWIAWKLY